MQSNRNVRLLFACMTALAVMFSVSVDRVLAQSLSNSFTGATPPVGPPAGPPCFGVGFSLDGDIYDPGSPYSVPMGPPGCGLGFPVTGGPYNINAFSSGLSPFAGAPIPYVAGSAALLFAVADLATGDPMGGCTPGTPGPFLMTDVGAESADLFGGGSSEAASDVFSTAKNGLAWPAPGMIAPGSSPNFQILDGDGAASIPFGLPTGPALGFIEPGPFIDAVDAFDAAPIAAWDPSGDTLPDLPVYWSVDAPTAAALGAFPSDIFVSLGGGFGLYAPGPALGLGAPADDVDALIVLDALGDGVYAPPADIIYYSVAPGSFAIGAFDCAGIPIQEGDLLTEGTPFAAPGIPCIAIAQENIGLWSGRFCGPNPITGASDDLTAADLTGAMASPPTTTTTSTTTTTTSTTTTTTLPALCGPAPIIGCRTAVSGKSQMQIKLKSSAPSKNKLKFKYSRGEATTLAEFADPIGGSADYRLCIWDSSVSPQPLLEAAVLPGGTCGTKPCWKALGTKGFKYKDRDGTPDGVDQVKFKEGVADKSQVQVKMRGLNFAAPVLPLTTTVTAQFIIDDGSTLCFEVPMSAPTKNDPDQFKAKGD